MNSRRLASAACIEKPRTPAWLAGLALASLVGCVSTAPRPAVSSLGCMRAIRDQLPAGLPDKQAHCLASGLIARHCSVTEAYIAGAGKEITDPFDGGDAEWADWRADRIGIACARHALDDADVERCCAPLGSAPRTSPLE